jgi:hypothetical protein
MKLANVAASPDLVAIPKHRQGQACPRMAAFFLDPTSVLRLSLLRP